MKDLEEKILALGGFCITPRVLEALKIDSGSGILIVFERNMRGQFRFRCIADQSIKLRKLTRNELSELLAAGFR